MRAAEVRVGFTWNVRRVAGATGWIMSDPANSITVVACIDRDAVETGELLSALAEQTRSAEETVFVLCGVGPDVARSVRERAAAWHGARVVEAAEGDPGRGRNQALARASGELVVCTPAGRTPDRTWLERMVGPFQDPKIKWVRGRLWPDSRSALAWGGGLAFRRELWRAAGGFPDGMAGEIDRVFESKLRELNLCGAEPPDTLIVSWYWPPVSRASTAVLANLFRDAPSDAFRVVTRDLHSSGDRVDTPPLETHFTSWRRRSGREGGLAEWIACIVALVGLVLLGRRLRGVRRFSQVMAVYPHRFGLLAGWIVARWSGVPLVVYMHDLFAETYRSGWRIKRWFWRWVDRRALSDAALVVVPSAEFAAHYRDRGARRVMVLPHCLPGDVRATPSPERDGQLELVYTGNLYDVHEDAIRAFLAASDSLGDVSLTLCTPPHRMLDGRSAKWVARADALAAMRNADVCVVVLGRNTPFPEEVRGCFPSKIVDYLATGRPILAVVPAGSFVDRFVREAGVGVVVNTFETREIHAAIDFLRDGNARKRLGHAAVCVARGLRAELHLPRLLGELDRLAGVLQEDPVEKGTAAPSGPPAIQGRGVTGAPRESVCAAV